MRAGTEQSLIVVDAGNLLVKRALSGENHPSDTLSLIAVQGIERAYREIGYDAVAVSTSDLSVGNDFLRQSVANGFPWVSANIFDAEGNLLFHPHFVKTVSGRTIGIIGLTGGISDTSTNYVIGEWRKALHTEISLLRKKCDLMILLSTLNPLDNQEILRNYDQIDILVSADKTNKITRPQVIKSSLVAGQSGNLGKYVGKLEIRGDLRGKWVSASTSTDNHQKGRLRSLDYQIKVLKDQQKSTKQDNGKKIEELQSTRQSLLMEMEKTRSEGKISEIQGEKSFAFSLLPVNPVTFDNKVNLIVQDIKKGIATFNKFRRTALNDRDPALRLALESNEIAGMTACVQCHPKQADFWKTTGHAKAFTTLSRHGQSYNLKCLPCHVTAGKISPLADETNRMYLLSLPADRQTIGCEVCHGPGMKHLESPETISPSRIPSEAICLKCHTDERDNNFEYIKKIKVISCPTS